MASNLSERVHWDGVREEVTEHCNSLIRCETVNPPGNETLVADYLRGVVEREGLTAQILEACPDVATSSPASPGTGNGRPLLLMAHSDVVWVEAGRLGTPDRSRPRSPTAWSGAVARSTRRTSSPAELMVMLLIKRQG